MLVLKRTALVMLTTQSTTMLLNEASAFYKGYNFSTTDVNMPWRSYLKKTKSMDHMSVIFHGQRVPFSYKIC
jgi:hypothetical protein